MLASTVMSPTCKGVRGLVAVAGQDGLGSGAEIDHQSAARQDRRGQRGDELAGAGEVEVAEAVAQADGGVERARARDLSHVGLDELDVDACSRRGPPGVPEGLSGDVDTGHAVAASGECQRVPSTAAGHVQDPGTGRQGQLALDEVHLDFGGLRRHDAAPELVGQLGKEVRVPGGRDDLGQRRAPERWASTRTAMSPGGPARIRLSGRRRSPPAAVADGHWWPGRDPGSHGFLHVRRRISADGTGDNDSGSRAGEHVIFRPPAAARQPRSVSSCSWKPPICRSRSTRWISRIQWQLRPALSVRRIGVVLPGAM